MKLFGDIRTPQEMRLLVAFFDLTGFTYFGRTHSAREIFETLSEYYEFVGDIVEASGGQVIKFLGDAGLIVYNEADINSGVLALKSLQDTGDAWLADRNMRSRSIIKVHFGSVYGGPLGIRGDKHFDILGETVNTAVTLKSNGFAMTPQVFRKLDSENRKLFKKHTPPVTYIPVTESHKD